MLSPTIPSSTPLLIPPAKPTHVPAFISIGGCLFLSDSLIVVTLVRLGLIGVGLSIVFLFVCFLIGVGSAFRLFRRGGLFLMSSHFSLF